MLTKNNLFFPVGEGERDMVLLQHDIDLEMPDKSKVRNFVESL